MKNTFIILIILGTFTNAFAFESDNISQRSGIAKLKDSTVILDEKVESRLRDIEAEMSGVSCKVDKPIDSRKDYQVKDEAVVKLMNEVNNQFVGNFGKSFLESAAEDFGKQPSGGVAGWGKREDLRGHIQQIAFSQSLYKNSGDLVSSFTYKDIPSNIKVNGVYMGTDKLTQFFVEGFDIYKYQKQGLDNSLRATFNSTEDSPKNTNRVVSYADMMANYQGYLFWQNIWRSEKPYFECKNDRWVRTNRKFTFTDYVNAGFDEGINCNVYKGEYQNKAEFKSTGEAGRCPADTNQCLELKKQFLQSHSKYLLSPSCLSVSAAQQKSSEAPAQIRSGTKAKGIESP